MKKILSFIVFTLCVSGYAQVGVGTSLPDASAMLDVVATNKGVLVPRVSLTGTDDITTISSGNKESLLVYNTATVSDVVPGFYYWNSSSWIGLGSAAVTPDADATIKGKLQLAGDLAGTAAAPSIAANAITTAKILDANVTTAKLADGSVTDVKIASGISASKVGLGNVDNTSDLAKPISTATQTAIDLKANLASPTFTGTVSGISKAMVGLGNVDNTTDLNKPISTATQTALDTKEATANKSTDGTFAANSDVKFPSEKATKTYVDAQVAAATIADADASTKGKLQLAGDLAGTAAAPSIAANAITTAKILDANVTTAKLADGSVTDVKIASGISASKVGLGNVNNTSDADKPVSTLQATAISAKEDTANKSTDGTFAANSDVKFPSEKATKTYVDAQVAAATIADADATTKGKLQLAGDLTGTAALPSIAANAITTAKILDANVTTAKLADGSVTDVKIALGISASKVGLGNVNNTSDADKPVSTLQATAISAKEDTANKSTDVTADGASDVKFPSVKAVKTYVDAVPSFYGTDGTLTSARAVNQNNADLTFTTGSGKLIVEGNFKKNGAVFSKFETVTATSYTVPNTVNTIVYEGAADATFTLPAASANPGMEIRIFNVSGYPVGFPAGTFSLSTANATVFSGAGVILFSDGAKWHLLSGM